MKIDKRLNLVIPVEDEKGGIVHIHSTPVMTETFDRYYLCIAKTFNEIHISGLGHTAGPRIAKRLLKDVATRDKNWEGEAGVEQGFYKEMLRLTNVIALGPDGWGYVPFEEALKTGTISADDADEVENAIVFFTVSWLMHKKNVVRIFLESATQLWGGSVTALNVTEYKNSLPTSTQAVASGQSAAR